VWLREGIAADYARTESWPA